MRPSHIASLFIGTFLFVTFILQWYRPTSRPLWICILLVSLSFLALLIKLSEVGRYPPPLGVLRQGEVGADKRKGITNAATIAICFVSIGLAFWNVSHANQKFQAQTLPQYASPKITILGTVTGDPSGKPPSALYPVLVESIESSGALIAVTGSVLIEDFGGWPSYRIGDQIRATGTLELPKNTEDFNYEHYLRLQGITAILKRAKIASAPTPYPPHPTIFLRHTLQCTKLWFESRITRLFPEPEAALITGLLTGERRGFSKRLLDDFATTGLTHLVAISGTNITIIIGILGGMLFWLPLKWRFLPQVAAIICFTLFVGASASVVRASIMGILGLTALQLGRIRDTRLAILWTAFFMTLWKPEQLWWDAGFQLSFAAVIGVTEIGPRFQKAFAKIPEILGLRDSLAMTLAAQLTTLPVSILTFGQVSLIAPLSNILAAPVVPIAMLFGFVGTMASIVWFPLGQLIGFAGYGAAEWITGVADVLAEVPYAAVGL